MDTKSKRVLKAQINSAVPCDKLIFRKNGTIEFRRSYFYRHGATPEMYAEKIKAAVQGAVIVSTYDNWQPLPRDSYFRVIFRVEANGEEKNV